MQKTHLSAKNRSTLTPWLGALPQRQEEHALRRAESKVPAVPRIGRPDPRGSTHFSVRKEEERPREPRLPHMQRMPGEPEKTLEVQLTTPETGSSGAREFAAQHRAKRPAAFGQPREPRQSYGQQDRQSSSREAAGAAGRESSARQERQLKIRSTPYGLDPEFRAPRTVPGAYPQGRQPGVRWDVGEQQGYGRNPESPAATQ